MQINPETQTDHFSEVFESVHIGLISIDPNGTVIAFNPAAEKIIGLNRADVLGKNYDDVFGSVFIQDDDFRFCNLKDTTSNTEITSRIRCCHSQSVDVCLSIAPVFTMSGKRGGTVLSIQNANAQNGMSVDSGGKSDRLTAMGQMAAQIAHEIRNPLGSIELFASVLERDLEDFAELREIAGHISSGVNSINTIISNLLLFIKPNQKPRMQALDVHEPLKDSLFFADRIFEANDGIAVHTHFHPDSLVINGDSELIKQITLNLILNAIQAMPDGGDLKISTRKIKRNGAGFAEIQFADTGCGISETDQNKIFDPFFTTKTRGTGLGLTIVENITRIHGGEIDIQSTEAKGTECIIILPLETHL